MRMPIDAVRRRILADLHAAGFSDLVPAHFAVLRYPGPQGRRPSDLAREAGVSRQAMNYLLRELERSGYLTRVPDESDDRARTVQLTERGLVVRATVRATVHTIERELQQQLGPHRFTQLHELLVALNACTINPAS